MIRTVFREPSAQTARVAGAALLLTLAAGCGSGAAPADPTGGVPTPPSAPDTTRPTPLAAPTLTREVLLQGRASPWDVAVAPNGALFFTEKCAGLSVRQPNGTVVRLFGTTGASLVAPDLVCQGQSGVHGVALDPAFATNRRVYLFMASTASTPRSNRVVRLELDAGYTTATNRVDLVTDIPYKASATPNGGAGAHSGGRLRFGPDGFLYVGTGDNHDGPLPQHPTRLGGKVLRITTAGAAAPGNNVPPGFDPRIFSYGHRNVQGLAFQPGTGAVYVAEHGPNHSDEVTRVVPGSNGGWDPQDRPALSCPGGYCGYAGSPASMPMTDRTRFPDARVPAWTNDSRSQGLGPAVFLEGAAWRAWNGRLLVGLMAAQRLVLLRLGDDGTVAEVGDVTSLPPARYRALTLGPDGSLYVATDAGELWRVTPGG
jgi:glucose/arabinose dehydrogenase